MYFEETKLNNERSFRSRFPLNKINFAVTNTNSIGDWPVQGVSTTLISDSSTSFCNSDSIVRTEQFKLTYSEQTLLFTTHYCPFSHFIFGYQLTTFDSDSEPTT